jgi:putative tryptophan/tyrosine transport system substrate-binding protein
MRRRDFIKIIAGPAIGWPLAARAQQSKKIPRLCFLTFDPGTLQATRFAFFEGLRDLGYVDGQSINILQRAVANDFQRSLPNVCAAKQTSSL